MKRTTRTSQAGFSLVELMVVVAIIGVLAAIAVPAVNKYIAKARQSEAKTNLASLYTSEKAFYAEYTVFDNRFGAVGYSPEGQLRYNVGFNGGTTAGVANGYNGTLTTAQSRTTTKTFCGTGGVMTNGCSMLNGATAQVPPDLTGTMTTTATSFVAGAAAVIHTAGTAGDRWTMTDSKVLTNTQSGIP